MAALKRHPSGSTYHPTSTARLDCLPAEDIAARHQGILECVWRPFQEPRGRIVTSVHRRFPEAGFAPGRAGPPRQPFLGGQTGSSAAQPVACVPRGATEVTPTSLCHPEHMSQFGAARDVELVVNRREVVADGAW